jgi:hypothetical protein
VILGARVLAEFGDAPDRYATAKAARTKPRPARSPGNPARRRPPATTPPYAPLVIIAAKLA